VSGSVDDLDIQIIEVLLGPIELGTYMHQAFFDCRHDGSMKKQKTKQGHEIRPYVELSDLLEWHVERGSER
jgi:hypothetical protein